jgi:hypothetical protein
MLGIFCSILIVVDLKHWKRIMSDYAIQYGDSLKIINNSPEREVKFIQALEKNFLAHFRRMLLFFCVS